MQSLIAGTPLSPKLLLTERLSIIELHWASARVCWRVIAAHATVDVPPTAFRLSNSTNVNSVPFDLEFVDFCRNLINFLERNSWFDTHDIQSPPDACTFRSPIGAAR